MTILDILYHIGAALILILGALVILNNFRLKSSWTFYLWALSASAWMLTLYWGFWFAEKSLWDASLITFRFAYATGVLLLSLMTVFFYYFPRVSVKVNFWVRFVYVFFTISLTIVSLTPLIHEALVIENGVYISDKLGPAYPLYTFDVVLNFFLGLYLALRKFLAAGSVERKKLAFATGGYFIFIFFALLTNVILPFFDVYPLLLQQLVPYLTLVFIVPAYISIQRYRFFNLSYISLRLVRRVIFYIIFLTMVWFAHQLISSLATNLNATFSVGLSILIAIYLLEKMDEMTPEFLSQELKSFMNAMAEMKANLFACDSYVKLRQLAEETFLLKLNFVHVGLYVVLKEKKNLKLPVYTRDKFTSELTKLGRDILVVDEIPFMKLEAKTKAMLSSKMENLGADLCIPLLSENTLIGFMALKKESGKSIHPFPREEIDELLAIKADFEVAFMNVLLKMNLEEENNLMKQIINKRTKQLRSKIQEINELLKQQSDFIAVTAHEFRTPLSIAMFQLDEVQGKSNNQKGDLANELEVINKSLDNLKSLTQKLFTVQQYDLNKVEVNLKPLDMNDFLKQVYRDFVPIMKEKNFKFSLTSEIQGPASVMADAAQLRQVFHNLLNNAFKFTPGGGEIRLTMIPRKRDFLICVTDTGDGIPNDLKKSVFGKFRTKKAGHGIGLGLYLCKKIIDLHNGKIWVQDAPGGGAEFCIQLKRSGK